MADSPSEKIGLQAVLQDEDFQTGLKEYLDGIQKMQRQTDVSLKAIGVIWDEQNKTYRKGGIAISESRVAEELDKLRAKFPPVADEAKKTTEAIEQGAQGMSILDRASAALGNTFSALSSHFVITAGDIANAVKSIGSALESVATKGIDTALEWSENMDKLGDMFGMSGEEASKWTVAMQHVGLTVDEGAQGLNFFTRGLSETFKVTKDGKKELTPFGEALQKLGVSAYDAKGKLKTFDQIMPEIMDQFQKLPAGVNSSALAMDLFGARGGSKFLDFLRQGKQGLSDASKFAEEFGLTVSTDAANAVEDFGFSMNDLDMAIKGIWNQIGQAMLPALKDLVKMVTEEILPAFAKWVKEHAPQLNQLLRDLGKWVKNEALPALMDLAKWVKDQLIPAIQQFTKWTSENFPKVQKAIDNAWKAIQPILKKLQELFAKTSDADFSGLVKSWQDVQKAIGDAWKFIQPILDKIFKELAKFWTEIQPKLQKAWDNIQKQTKAAWDAIWKIIQPIVETIQKFIDDHWNEIAAIIEGVMKEIQGVITVVWNAIKGIIKVALDLIGGDFGAAGKDWQDTMTAIWNGIEQIIDGAWKIIQGIVGLALAAILQLIQNKMTDVQNAIANLFNGAVAAVQTAWNNIINAVTTMLGTLINGIKAKAQEIIDAITAPFLTAVNTLLSVNLFDLGKKVVQGLLDGVISIASSIKDALVAPFVNAITAIWNTDWGAVGRHVMEMIAGGLEAIKNRVISAIQGPLQQLIDLIQSLLRSIGIGSVSGFGSLGALGSARVSLGAASGASFVSSRSVVNNFNMTVHTSSPYSTATRDFGVLRALAGG